MFLDELPTEQARRAAGPDLRLYRRYVCLVCGHVELVPLDQELHADYVCPLCDAPRKAMAGPDDPRLRKHSLALERLAPGIWRADKSPPFPPEWSHTSYLLEHPRGLVLYDPPPFFSDGACAAVRARGEARLLVLSHEDFVGPAADWCAALDVPAWLGVGERPMGAHPFEPDRWMDGPTLLAPDLELLPVPGHTKGSLALYWSGAPGGPALFAGDALTLWEFDEGRVQLVFPQHPPLGEALRELVARPMVLLATCAGWLHAPERHLRALVEQPEPCGRPWCGDRGGLWLRASDIDHGCRRH
jgi:hypothetical protein